MAVNHHGGSGSGPNEELKRTLDEMVRRFAAQGEGAAPRAYPKGRLGADDDGELVFAVTADRDKGTVNISFNKPVAWMGLYPSDVVALVKTLVAKAREVSDEPLTIELS